MCLFSQAYAAIFLVEPVDTKLQSGQSVALGSIAKGETLRLITRKKSELPAQWDSISVNREMLPEGWGFEEIETDKTMIALLSTPSNALVSTQRIQFTLSSKSQPAFAETFYADLSVRDNLLTVTIENLNQGVVVGETAQFKLIASNDSIAEHNIAIASDLPSYWFEPMSVRAEPHSTLAVDLNVNALVYGERSFRFTVSSLHNDSAFNFPALLSVSPTLRGKYVSALFGFPFFSPGLLPYYLLNGFLSLLS